MKYLTIPFVFPVSFILAYIWDFNLKAAFTVAIKSATFLLK